MGKETEEIIMAGFGGQGILFLGKVLAETGMLTGQNVSWIPAYGPEMRGGTANCSVVISRNEIASPIVTEPDTLIAMNIPSVARFVDKIRPGGTLIYNSSLIDQKEFRSDIKICAIPANQLANEVGSDKVANVVMAGAYARFSDMMNFDAFIKAFPTLVPGKKKELLELNLAALKKGYDCANSTH